RSFVPHEYVPRSGPCEAPVQLSTSQAPSSPIDVLINLGAEIPPCAALAPHITEVLDGDESRRRAGRVRFKAYRDRGLQPITHTLKDNTLP
ncbi:MAG TPA: DNA polymerase III subunit chi, partial [Steroidobacteraceae bacterium]